MSQIMPPARSSPHPDAAPHTNGASPFAAPPQRQHVAPARRHRHTRRGTPWFAWMLGGCLGMLALLVLFCAVVAGLLGGLAFRFANAQDASDTQTQSFSVVGAPALHVQSDAGMVHVQSGPDGEVRVATTRHARAASSDAARGALRDISIITLQTGDTLSVTTATSNAGGFGVTLSADLVITVPRQASVVILSQAGAVQVDGVSGSISASVRHGDLRLNDVTFTAASVADLQQGSATISGALEDGASLDLHVAAGDATVSLPQNVPVHVDAATAAGNLSVSGWPVFPIHNGSSVTLLGDTRTTLTDPHAPEGGALSIRVDTGNITLQFT